MSRRVVLHRRARAEYREAAEWYERARPGWGAVFVSAVRSAIAKLGSSPELYARVHDDVREVLLERFPYAIYYRIEPHRIQVVAIYHTSRDPTGWRDRD